MSRGQRKSGKYYKNLGQIKETRTFKVCGAGDGYIIYLPKTLCRIHDIMTGDRIRVTLLDHYREIVED